MRFSQCFSEDALPIRPHLFVDKYRTVDLQDVDLTDSKVQDNVENAVELLERDNKTDDTEMRTDTPYERKIQCAMTLEKDKTPKKISIQDRLGEIVDDTKNPKTIKLSEFRREEEKLLGYHQNLDTNDKSKFRLKSHKSEIIPKNGSNSPIKSIHKIKSGIFKTNKFDLGKTISKHGLNRLGVMSKVYIPLKKNESEQLNKREVKSVVQVKPRVIPSNSPQPNKNLLLKAMAEAQKSIEQALKPKISKVRWW